MQNVLAGNRIRLIPGKRDSLQFEQGFRIFLPVCRQLRKSYVLAAHAKQPGERSLVSPSMKANYKVT